MADTLPPPSGGFQLPPMVNRIGSARILRTEPKETVEETSSTVPADAQHAQQQHALPVRQGFVLPARYGGGGDADNNNGTPGESGGGVGAAAAMGMLSRGRARGGPLPEAEVAAKVEDAFGDFGDEDGDSDDDALPPTGISNGANNTTIIGGGSGSAEQAQNGPAADEASDSDSGSDDIAVTRAWLPGGTASVGETLQCQYALSHDVATSGVADDASVFAFLCFAWSRSLDGTCWQDIARGIHTDNAHMHTLTADDLGHYIRCEAGFDEQHPLATDKCLVVLPPSLRVELPIALEDGVRGFNCGPGPEQTNREKERAHKDNVEDAPTSNGIPTTQPQNSFKLVITRTLVKLYRVETGKTTVQVKAAFSKDCQIRLHTGNAVFFDLLLPTGVLTLSIASTAARDYLALVFRMYSAMNVVDICTDVLSRRAYEAWRGSAPFHFEDWLTTPRDIAGDGYARSVDTDMREHELEKYGSDWLLVRETLQAVVS